jgi:hypothetical protein
MIVKQYSKGKKNEPKFEFTQQDQPVSAEEFVKASDVERDSKLDTNKKTDSDQTYK